MKVTLNQQGLAQMRDRIRQAIEEASLAAAEQLDENTSAGPRSGRKYPGLPRTSSAPSEFLQEQGGGLNDSIDVRDGDHEFQKRPGFHDAPYGTDVLGALEFGNRAGTLEGRKSVTRTFESGETHDKMRRAAGKVKR
jgi:hypothetical protein